MDSHVPNNDRGDGGSIKAIIHVQLIKVLCLNQPVSQFCFAGMLIKGRAWEDIWNKRNNFQFGKHSYCYTCVFTNNHFPNDDYCSYGESPQRWIQPLTEQCADSLLSTEMDWTSQDCITGDLPSIISSPIMDKQNKEPKIHHAVASTPRLALYRPNHQSAQYFRYQSSPCWCNTTFPAAPLEVVSEEILCHSI